MSIGGFLRSRSRLFTGPLAEADTPKEGRWSDDWADLPPAENGMGRLDDVRIVQTGLPVIHIHRSHMSSVTKVNLAIVAGSCAVNFPIPELTDNECKLNYHPGYKPQLDEPWRKKKPWRR